MKRPLAKANGKGYCSEFTVMLFKALSFDVHLSERNDQY